MLTTDISNFTSFADVTEPEYVFETLHEYHATVGRIAEAERGTVFDVAGDLVYLLFEGGAESDGPVRAVRTALAIDREGKKLTESWRRRGQALSGLKIALHAGFASVGPVEAGSFSREVAVGSPVYTLFHLGRAARSGEILATHAIADAAVGLAEVVERPDIKLSAITRKIDVFELRAPQG